MSNQSSHALQVWNALRRANRTVALLVGAGLLFCAVLVLVDVGGRAAFGHGLGGSDEISGYAMALLTSWGMGYALLELGHVRIELLHTRLKQRGAALLDLFALASLAAVISFIALRAWPVLERSWLNNSSANTPLETPLWIVQLPWLLGWVWFALSALISIALALHWIWRGEFNHNSKAIGLPTQGDTRA